jgi:hypothetical protein
VGCHEDHHLLTGVEIPHGGILRQAQYRSV